MLDPLQMPNLPDELDGCYSEEEDGDDHASEPRFDPFRELAAPFRRIRTADFCYTIKRAALFFIPFL